MGAKGRRRKEEGIDWRPLVDWDWIFSRKAAKIAKVRPSVDSEGMAVLPSRSGGSVPCGVAELTYAAVKAVCQETKGGQGEDKGRTWTVLLLVVLINPTVAQGTQNCLDFDGSDHVEIDHDASLNMGTGGITIEAWINTSAVTPNGYWPRIVSKDRYDNGCGYNLFIAHHTNKVSFEVWIDGNWYGVWGPVVNDGNWQYVVGKRSGNRIYVYKDGVQSGGWVQTGSGDNVNNSVQLTLANSEDGGAFFTGKIDEVRIWNTDRSIDDIQQDMFKELEGTEADLKA